MNWGSHGGDGGSCGLECSSISWNCCTSATTTTQSRCTKYKHVSSFCVPLFVYPCSRLGLAFRAGLPLPSAVCWLAIAIIIDHRKSPDSNRTTLQQLHSAACWSFLRLCRLENLAHCWFGWWWKDNFLPRFWLLVGRSRMVLMEGLKNSLKIK